LFLKGGGKNSLVITLLISITAELLSLSKLEVKRLSQVSSEFLKVESFLKFKKKRRFFFFSLLLKGQIHTKYSLF